MRSDNVGLNMIDPRRKCIVSHFPLCDSADYHFSIGIHTIVVRFLDNSDILRVSGIWFEEVQPPE